jgi:hypothetical protein
LPSSRYPGPGLARLSEWAQQAAVTIVGDGKGEPVFVISARAARRGVRVFEGVEDAAEDVQCQKIRESAIKALR